MKKLVRRWGRQRNSIFILIVGTLLLLGASLHAQTLWLGQQGRAVAVEWLKPDVKGVDSSFLTSVLFVSGRFPLSQSLTLVGELPMTYFDGDVPPLQSSESSSALGNLYLGMEIRKQGLPIYAELGLGFPLGANLDSPAAIVGQATVPEHFEAFTDYDISGKVRLHLRHALGSDFLVHLQTGWSGGNSFAQDGGPSNFSTLDYGIHLGFQKDRLKLIGGLAGRYLLDGRTFHMSRFSSTGLKRSTHQFAATASINWASVHPGLYFHLLTNDYVNEDSRNFIAAFFADEIVFVFGLNLAIPLR